jgi:hypothetical protein
VIEDVGKNLLKFKSLTPSINNGITFSPQKDGTIILSGTLNDSSASTRFELDISDGLYVYNDDFYETNETSYTQIIVGSSWKNPPYSKTDISVEVSNNTVQIYIATKTSHTTPTMLKPMLRFSTQTTFLYEPYQGKTYRVEIGQKNKVEDTLTGANIGSNGQIGSDSNYDLAIAKVKSGVTYTITTDDSAGFVGGFFTNKPTPQATSYNNSRIVTANKTFTAPIDGYVAFRMNTGYATPQCEQGSQATPYVPYNPNLPDAIYGGELDVITGELTVTYGEVDLGSLTYQRTNNFYYCALPDAKKPSSNSTPFNAISDRLKVVSANGVNKAGIIALTTTGNIYTTTTDYDDGFLVSPTGQLAYELAEPYTIQLTPQQIRLLKGANHLSCNTGDLTIKYYPDNVLGQLKGDIESEIKTVDDKIKNIKIMKFTDKQTTDDGQLLFPELENTVIISADVYEGTYGKMAIPYIVGNVPRLKVVEVNDLSTLSYKNISGTVYYYEI